MTSTPPILPAHKRTWLHRNWKWFVPCACVAGAALFAAFAAIIVTVVMGVLKSSDAYSGALSRVRSAPTIVEELGTPITERWYVTGSISVSGSSGEAELAIPIIGPKGKATVYVEAKKKLGQWHFLRLVVQTYDTKERIDLLENSPNQSQVMPAKSPPSNPDQVSGVPRP